MTNDDQEVEIRVQLEFRSGRDDIAIRALTGIKPRHRAEKVRQLVVMGLTGAMKNGDSIVASGGATAEEAMARAEAAKPAEEKKEEQSPQRGLDLGQLDGIEMEIDFSGGRKG